MKKTIIFFLFLLLFLGMLSNVKGVTNTGTFTPFNVFGAGPQLSNVYPVNGSSGIATTPVCYLTVNDPEGDTMNLSFYENTTGSWALQQANSSISNGTYLWTYNNASSYNTLYYWRICSNDGVNWTNATYCFTTMLPVSLSCRFTYKVTGSMVITTPTIAGATHYKWTVESIGETAWIPYSDVHDQQFVLSDGGKYRITLTAMNSTASVDYSTLVTTKISPETIDLEPAEKIPEEEKPKVKNIFEDTGISDWFKDRNAGEFMIIGLIGVFVALFIVIMFFKRRPKKVVYYTNIKKVK